MSYYTILAIGSGGFLGAITRAWINGIINHHLPHTLPYGTLAVNLGGSFLIGVLFAYFAASTFLGVHAKSFLTTGFLGALTTYSTFAMETVFLLSGGQILLAAANMALNLFGSVLMAAGGFYLCRTFLGNL